MNKEVNFKASLLLIVFAAVVFMAVGYAAYTRTVTIKPSASVSPSASDFNVHLSSAQTSDSTTAVTPSKSPTTITAGNATLSSTTISGMSATFTAPGQSVTYTFYARNTGKYKAYLKSITYASSFKTCTAKSGTTQSLVNSACNGISVSTTVGSESAVTASKTFSNHTLAKGGNEKITVVISYASGSAQADGDFTVTFKDISLLYSSAA